MLKQIDNVLCYLITGLGIVFLTLTPMYTDSFFSRAGVEFMGAFFFLVFLGLLNFARIKSGHPSARTMAIIANLIALAYLLVVVIALQEPAAIGMSLPVFALCCTSWMNRPNGSPMDTKHIELSHLKEDTKPSFPERETNQLRLDEYKALHEEITMCQHEMHRTWSWASIAAAALYTWLYTSLSSTSLLPHRSDINAHLERLQDGGGDRGDGASAG